MSVLVTAWFLMEGSAHKKYIVPVWYDCMFKCNANAIRDNCHAPSLSITDATDVVQFAFHAAATTP